MKYNFYKLIFVFILALSSIPGYAKVLTYPGPSSILPSDQYLVQVIQNGRKYNSFVYQTSAKWRSNRSKTTSWTTFSFSGRVTVKVTKLNGSFSACKILPSSYNITLQVHKNTVTFELDRPRKISVEFDGDITHPMLVFANSLETNVPLPTDPNVIYFGQGVHNIGADFSIGSNKTVYLSGGAYIKGKFNSRDGENIKIIGRGILSGEDYEHKTSHMIKFRGCNDILIEGITIIDSPNFCISLRGSNHTVRNVKMIGWYFNTDGVSTGYNGLVEECFFKLNDDALKLYFSKMIVRDCVIWQMENGAPFQISWNMPSDNSHFHVSNIDVIRIEHKWNNRNEAVFDSIHGGRGHMSDYLFEDIRIENADWRLFYITIDKNEFADSSRGMGRISNLTFKNITVDGPMKKPNTIKGWDSNHRVSNVLFENVMVNGKYITNAEEGNFEIDPQTTDNIRFKLTKSYIGL
jgi:hypothetical protein